MSSIGGIKGQIEVDSAYELPLIVLIYNQLVVLSKLLQQDEFSANR
jgi:hypothetical protein